MEVPENDSPQSTLVEARKRQREEEGGTSDAELEGDAEKARHSKRPRTESPESGSADARENAVMGKSERSKSQASGSFGSEEGEVDEGQETSVGDKIEEGELHTSAPEGELMDSSDDEHSSDGEHVGAAASDSSTFSSGPPTSGWNRGISAGQVQTSLSSMTRKVPSAPAPTASQVGKETSPSPQSSLSHSSSATTASYFQKSGVSLKLPPPGDRNAGESWQVRFREWTNTLLKLNPEQVSVITPELVLDAYNHFIDRVCSIHNRKKKAAKAGAEIFSQKGTLSGLVSSARGDAPDSSPRDEAKDEMGLNNGAGGHGLSQVVQSQNRASFPGAPTAADWEFALESDSAPQASAHGESEKDIPINGVSTKGLDRAPPKQNGSSTMPPPPQLPISIPSGDEELKLQQKYFPRFDVNLASEMCILCLQRGHNASSCPTQGCKHCDAGYQHCSYACPSKRRCGKCKGLGHTLKDCTNDEITPAQEDALACAHCGSDDHYEKDCDLLWRTYRIPDSPTKCHSIRATCASCGEEGHFFFDCEAGRLRFPKPRTWCEENLARYSDQTSKRGPISESTPGPSLRRPELVGRSNENIYFESDDSDGEMPFIGNRVQPKKSVGRINVSSNIHFGNHANGPPGESRLPPPATLPPRPQSYADTIRSEARQRDGVRRQHQLPPRPPAARRGGSGNYQAVPPPPGLQRNLNQGSASRDHPNGNSSRGGRNKNSSRGGRGGGKGNGRGGNPRSNRGGGKWQ